MSIKVCQEATFKSKDWWEWAVWLTGTIKELAAIKHVVYTLHATFPDPVRVVKTRRNGFRLASAGWGEFEIYLEIVRIKGPSLTRTHYLKLGESHASLRPPAKEKRPSPASAARAPAVQAGLPAGVPFEVKASAAAAPPLPPVLEGEWQGRTIYVSSGAADSDFARELKARLAERGMKVTSADDMAAGQPWENTVRNFIRDADATVFIVSGHPSLWSSYEMQCAVLGNDKPVIPLLVGSGAQLPPSLASHHAVHVSSVNDVNVAAASILEATNAI